MTTVAPAAGFAALSTLSVMFIANLFSDYLTAEMASKEVRGSCPASPP